MLYKLLYKVIRFISINVQQLLYLARQFVLIVFHNLSSFSKYLKFSVEICKLFAFCNIICVFMS